MKWRCFAWLCTPWLIGLVGCGSDPLPPADALQVPGRVILISLDTLRADYLGLYGFREFPSSPVLDGLASESVVFEQSIVVEPFTLTSHMSLMTGLYPAQHGVTPESGLAAGTPTLASLLAQNGYRTAAFTDGGWMRNKWGLGRGFEHYAGAKRRGLKRILGEADHWLDEHASEPFLLFLHTYDVHGLGSEPNYQAAPDLRGSFSGGLDSALVSTGEHAFKRLYRKQSELSAVDRQDIRASYAECVRSVDRGLGGFFDDLRARGLYDDSLIVVWSDHGEGLRQHEQWGHGELFEHTIRSPLLIKLPGAQGAGKRVEQVVSGVDIMPTILELLGLPAETGLPGRSLVPAMRGEELPGQLAFSVSRGEGRPKRARASHQKLWSVRSGPWHAISNGVPGAEEFFELSNDPGEEENLWPSEDPQALLLMAELAAWRRQEIAAHGASHGGLPDPDMDADTRAELEALGYGAGPADDED